MPDSERELEINSEGRPNIDGMKKNVGGYFAGKNWEYSDGQYGLLYLGKRGESLETFETFEFGNTTEISCQVLLCDAKITSGVFKDSVNLGYGSTQYGYIEGGTFYGPVGFITVPSDAAIISGGTFYNAVVNGATGTALISDGSFFGGLRVGSSSFKITGGIVAGTVEDDWIVPGTTHKKITVANGHKIVKVNGNTLKAPYSNEADYTFDELHVFGTNFTGMLTLTREDGKVATVTLPITEDITPEFYTPGEEPKPDDDPKQDEEPKQDDTKDDTDTKPKTYTLSILGGTVKVNGTETAVDEHGDIAIAEGAEVEVTFDKGILSDAQTFDQWIITPKSVLNAVDPKAETITFTMPGEKVTIEAMTKDASIEDEPNILGTAAVIGTAAVGTAVLAWQGYQLGTELYLKYALPAGAAIPTNCAELAELVWNDAGKSAPAAVLPEDTTDTQKALTWAAENELIPNGKGAEEKVSKIDVIRSWNRVQEMNK